MIEGKQPFNLDAAKKVFTTFAEAEKVKPLFPDTSKTGGDTAALPAIWENKADFEAKLAKFVAEAKAADRGDHRRSTRSRRRSPRCARIAAAATSPTASGRHSDIVRSAM